MSGPLLRWGVQYLRVVALLASTKARSQPARWHGFTRCQPSNATRRNSAGRTAASFVMSPCRRASHEARGAASIADEVRPEQRGRVTTKGANLHVAISDVRPSVDAPADERRQPQDRSLIDDENILQAINCWVRIDSIYCTTDCAEVGKQQVRAAGGAVPLHVVTGTVAKAAFGNARRSRIFALARRPPTPQLRDLAGRPGDIVALDGVRLTGNIGAIARSALAFDAAGLVLIDSALASVFDRRLIRASRGAVFSLPLIRTDGHELLAFLQHHQIPLVGLAPRAPYPVATTSELAGQVALLLGGEKHGTSPLLHQCVAQQVRIPTTTEVESLNVSVAAAIGLYARRVVAESAQPRQRIDP